VDRYGQGLSGTWEKTLIIALPHLHYVAEPETGFIYSNMGYAALGAALTRAAGQPYLQYVPSHIFAPLSMERPHRITGSLGRRKVNDQQSRAYQ
jgi:CubicO group peptidase (beta-lactamase class C family)